MKIGNNLHLDASRVLEKRGDGHPRNPSVFPATTKGYVPRPTPNMLLGMLLMMYAPPVDGVVDRPYNRHAMNNSIARNKLSCTLDSRRPEARELFLRLVEQSDLFVENLKTATIHRMGIHESQLLDRNPRLLVLRLPAAGLTGDWANYTGFGAQFDGLSGLVSLTGHHDREMVETPATTYMDAATGPAGAFAALAALHYRAGVGRGQLIELAQLENTLNQLGDAFVESQLGHEPERTGNRDPYVAPQGVYHCRGDDRWLAITTRDDAEWAALARTIGRADLLDDPRFATAAGRYASHDELDRLISEWTMGQDVMAAFHTLQAAGVTAGPCSMNRCSRRIRTSRRGVGSGRSRRATWGRIRTSASRSRASPRRGTAARRHSARTTTTCSGSCSASTTTSTSGSSTRRSSSRTTSTRT